MRGTNEVWKGRDSFIREGLANTVAQSVPFELFRLRWEASRTMWCETWGQVWGSGAQDRAGEERPRGREDLPHASGLHLARFHRRSAGSFVQRAGRDPHPRSSRGLRAQREMDVLRHLGTPRNKLGYSRQPLSPACVHISCAPPPPIRSLTPRGRLRLKIPCRISCIQSNSEQARGCQRMQRFMLSILFTNCLDVTSHQLRAAESSEAQK